MSKRGRHANPTWITSRMLVTGGATCLCRQRQPSAAAATNLPALRHARALRRRWRRWGPT